MDASVNNYDKATPLIEYDNSTRSYNFLRLNHPDGTHQVLWYCPWCGSELPKELGEVWCDILEKEFNISDPFDKEKDKVPQEFRTDEWWKKRGL